MGCTSSAPNTLTANVSKEDKSIQFGEDVEETYSEHEATDAESENQTETEVLPISDSIPSVQLVRNNQSTNSLEPEKGSEYIRWLSNKVIFAQPANTKSSITRVLSTDVDLNTNGNIEERKLIDTYDAIISTQDEEKVDILSKLKLEEVVGKFIEITHDTENMFAEDVPAEPAEKNTEESSTKIETEQNEHSENNAESEEASPSQSQSSRATRWEALADIAAELPPSLAVDPLTGQIYSLSK